DRVAGDEIGARVLVVRECRERRGIRAPLGRALERAFGVTETRLGPEIGARRHAIAPAGHRRWPGRAVPCGRFTRQAHPRRPKHARPREVAYMLALREPGYATSPGASSCPRVWPTHRKVPRRSSTSVRTGPAFPRSIRPTPPRPCTGCWP